MAGHSAPQGVVAGSIPLFAGHPAPDLLPIVPIRQVMDAVWARPDVTRLFNYGDEQGNAQLIGFLADRLRREESLSISRDNLMITGGATGGVSMIAQNLTRAGDVVMVDAPSYRDALHIFRDGQLDLRAIPVDQAGARADAMEAELRALEANDKMPRFYYVVPNFQNPTGITMPRHRRQAIIQLSRRYGFAIVEDDVYRDIHFDGPPPASFFALAGGHRVLRLGSFSKTLAPGMRIGWLLASADMIQRFVESGTLRMGGGANPFSSAVVADYCLGGRWDEHVGWLRGQYRRRRDFALEALRQSMPAAASWTRPEGGYFIWLRLPRDLSLSQLESAARRQGVYFAPGRDFFVDPEAGDHHLRLSYSYLSHDDLRAGIGILGRLIGRLLKSWSQV